MQYTTLGSSGITVSIIALGGMSLPGDEVNDIQLIHKALDLGINFIDTADLYLNGRNESIIGKAIKGRREKVVLASKGGNQPTPETGGWRWNPNPSYLKTALEASLKRLETDYLDLYQLHGGTLEDPTDELIRFFEDEKKRGTIRAYGISSIRPVVIDYWVRHAHLDSLMVQYSGLDRRPEEQIFPLLENHNIAVLARGTVAKGMLAGKPAKDYLGIPEKEIASIVDTAFSNNSTNAATNAIRYALNPEPVKVAVVGLSSEVQLHQAVEAGNSPHLSDELMKRLNRLFPEGKYENHRC